MNRSQWSFFLVALSVGLSIGWGIATAPKIRPEPLFSPRYPDLVVTKRALKSAHPNLSQTQPAPVSAVVGHHLLAVELFRDTLLKIPARRIRHVVLIAPNHFLEGRGRIQTMNQSFSTPYGPIAINDEFVQGIVDDGAATIEPATFRGEHGVANLLPLIKRLLPEADIAPVLVWEGISQATLDRTREALGRHLQPDTLILGSFDFTHYLPSAVAENNDQRTKQMITNLDLDHLRTAAVDSPEGLWLWAALTKDQGGKRFIIDSATNSGTMTKAPAETEVTSYINGRFFR